MIPKLTKLTDGSIRQFNPSIVKFHGNTVLAIREMGRILLCIMEDGKPGTTLLVVFNDRRCSQSQEDPRLFVYRNALWIAFVGVSGRTVRQMYGKIDMPFNCPTVNECYRPNVQGREGGVEKNWAVFTQRNTGELHDSLYAVYLVKPHVVVKIEGETATPVRWSKEPDGGPHCIIHGGCVVKHNDLYYHWWHGYTDDTMPGNAGGRVYNYGVYTFDSKFQIVNWVNRPVMTAFDAFLEPKPMGYLHSVVFPGGGIVEDGYFKLAVGVHDQWCELHEYKVGDVERLVGNRELQASRLLCDHLGGRIEFKPGCGGFNCRHRCDSPKMPAGTVAIPGGNCQTCNERETVYARLF